LRKIVLEKSEDGCVAVAGVVDAFEGRGARYNLGEGQEGHVHVVGEGVRGEVISREISGSADQGADGTEAIRTIIAGLDWGEVL
jgi:hypothetical protein